MIWKDILTATVRHLLGYLAVYLVASGIIDEELSKRLLSEGPADIVSLILSAGVLTLPILWSWRDKIRKRIELLTGLEMASGTSEEVNRMVAKTRSSDAAF